MLRAEVAALHEEIDCCEAPAAAATAVASPTANGETAESEAAESGKGDVAELQVLLRTTREEVGSVKAALVSSTVNLWVRKQIDGTIVSFVLPAASNDPAFLLSDQFLSRQ